MTRIHVIQEGKKVIENILDGKETLLSEEIIGVMIKEGKKVIENTLDGKETLLSVKINGK